MQLAFITTACKLSMVVIVFLFSIPVSAVVTDVQTACDSYTWNGSVYTTSGSYTENITNSYGCDSIVSQLTVNSTYTSSESQTAAIDINGTGPPILVVLI